MSRLAAVTGGSGFLGRHVIRALAEAGWRVRILSRREPDLPELADISFEVVRGALEDEPSLAALTADADAVIHIAGLVKARDKAAFFEANEAGAGRVAKAAASGGRFILISSMAAREPRLSAYAASKLAGETAVKQHQPDAIILRPGAIYGTFDQESLKVLKLANSPIQLMLNRPDARVAMIDARDAARSIVAALDAPDLAPVQELADARLDGYRWDELAATAAKALGRSPRPVKAPAALLRGMGLLGDVAGKISGGSEILTSGKAREILHADWSVKFPPPASIHQPRIALLDGLTDMAKASGLLRG
ncbi:MAG: SDR family NAD(P)-dependent oxidoreductase [Pseudomonadota bacterium]